MQTKPCYRSFARASVYRKPVAGFIRLFTFFGAMVFMILVGCSGGETTVASGSPVPPSPSDTTAPTISNVSVNNVTTTSATITWTTNEASSTQVQYGTTTAYGSSVNGPANTTNHSVSLSGLTANTSYHYRAVSADSAGNSALSSNATFITAPTAPDLNCTSSWPGSEESTTITAWPYRDCFRTNPVGTRTRMTNNVGAEVVWEQGTGWNGQNALRVRPPDGSTGSSGQAGQGYAGLGGHVFHSVRTKRLNIRYLIRYNSNWAQYAQRNKWEVAIKYDYSDLGAPVRREGCERGIVEGRVNALDYSREDMAPRQGVCTNMDLAPNWDGWYWGAGVRENEWIVVENEFDLETGRYRTYITTQDGTFNQSVHSEIDITTGTSGAPAELVPNPYWWGSIDCTAGCYWDSPADQGVVPRPVDTYIWYSHVVISDRYIGPPTGFVQ